MMLSLSLVHILFVMNVSLNNFGKDFFQGCMRISGVSRIVM